MKDEGFEALSTGTQPATIVLYGVGPVEFKYVNASDDPRNKT